MNRCRIIARRAGPAILLGALVLWAAPLPVSTPQERALNLIVPMRDGIRLRAHLFRPAGTGRFPTVLVRTPYDKGSGLLQGYETFVDHGYAVLVQDVRGRYSSEGIFTPLTQEVNDGDDTLNWIARQTWSNGKVVMSGGSYVGIVQWKAALSQNRHLRAIAPVVAGDDDFRDRFYSTGGALKLGHRLLWLSENMRTPASKPDFATYVRHLPLRTADRAATGQNISMFQQVLDHPTLDQFWKGISTREQISRVQVPALIVGGWYDNYVESDLDAFVRLHKHQPATRLVIGPWPHNMSYKFLQADFGPHSSAPIKRYQLEMYDAAVKPALVPPVTPPAPVRLFVMGINEWRDEYEWPLRRARLTPMYLTSNGRANTGAGDGELSEVAKSAQAFDQFVYNPANPVPTMGGAVCCNPAIYPWGPLDQSPIEKRNDVLVYTGKVLDRDVEVTGLVQASLWVSTSAPDTDFTAKLVDVFPNGEARLLTDGILRMRYRDSLEKSVLVSPGQKYQIMIDLGPTSNVFRTGHRIRLEISSSNFPRFDRNQNTGHAIGIDSLLSKATQTVWHDRQHGSVLLLPVVPAATLQASVSRRRVSRANP